MWESSVVFTYHEDTTSEGSPLGDMYTHIQVAQIWRGAWQMLAFNKGTWGKQVSWYFTPSQPVWFYQGEGTWGM